MAEKVSGQLCKEGSRAVRVKAMKPITNHIETDLGKRVLKKLIYEI